MTRSEAVFFRVMTVLSLATGGYALFLALTGFVHVPPVVAGNTLFSPWGVNTHIAASGLTLILGPFQFDAGLRQRRPGLHRFAGRVYVLACLTGGVSGLLTAWGTTAGPVAGAGFFVLAIIWLYTLARAVAAVLARNFPAHERWMVRCFALSLGAVTLRLYLGLGVPLFGFNAAYPVIAWIAWVPNLLIAELWLASRKARVRP